METNPTVTASDVDVKRPGEEVEKEDIKRPRVEDTDAMDTEEPEPADSKDDAESKPDEGEDSKPVEAETEAEAEADAEAKESDDKPTEETKPEVKTEDSKEQADESAHSEAASLPTPSSSIVESDKPAVEMPKHQVKYAASSLKAVKRLKDAAPFIHPVDPVKLNIPTYFEVIKYPMDLGTMEKKLNNGEYGTKEDMIADVQKIVDNCLTFNGADSFISSMAKSLFTSFERHMFNFPSADAPVEPLKKKKSLGGGSSTRTPRGSMTAGSEETYALQPSGVPTIRRESAIDGRPKREIHPPKPKDLPYTNIKPRKKKHAIELRFCNQVLKELTSKKHEEYSFPFLLPVDPVALNCPSYFKIIKEPMDLSTVQEKMNNNAYETADEFESDVRLIFKNCYRFNPDGTPVNKMGKRLEAIFDKKWAEKPIPPPSPPPTMDDSSDYDEYSSDEDLDSSITNPAIAFLEEQIERMKQELTKMKKDAAREMKRSRRRGSSKRSKSGSKRKGSRSSDSGGVVVSYEMKKELSERIPQLKEKQLQHVINLIHESMPQLKSEGQDEIELDMDQLDPHTLMKLYNYVVKDDSKKKSSSGGKSSSSSRPSSSVYPGQRKKSKPMSESEQAQQIEQIQKKLRQFDEAEGGSATPPPTNGHFDDSSDDDSGSSSEEE
ncbi:Bromodomain-containing factor 2 [Yarrowia sp. C11]|nr:Bromodomain-containing factor 2 [Yarrowia sp. C11]KAG5370577.1 Bromodomain-containing factor 2 [Yarrowia sp. E02]